MIMKIIFVIVITNNLVESALLFVITITTSVLIHSNGHVAPIS